jgi:predicted dehydrogenase
LSSDVRLVVVGFGSIGRRHAQNALALGVREVMLVRSSGDSPNDLGLREFHSLSELPAPPDAAVVATPTFAHLPAARELLNAGIPTLLEKPVSHEWAGVAELSHAARSSGVVVMPAHNMRFHAGVAAAAGLLRDGAVGTPQSSRFFVGQYLPDWRPGTDYRASYSASSARGGGVVLDLIHEIDLALWMTGPFARVGAWMDHVSDLEIDSEDVAEIILEREDGGVTTVHLDYLTHPYSRWLEVTGNAGTLRFDYAANRLTFGKPGSGAAKEISIPPFERNDMYVALMKHFLDVVRGKGAAQVTLEDGVRALDVALSAKRASRDQRWIDLPALDR